MSSVVWRLYKMIHYLQSEAHKWHFLSANFETWLHHHCQWQVCIWRSFCPLPLPLDAVLGQIQCVTVSVHMLKNVTECTCSEIVDNSHRKRHSVNIFERCCNSLQLPVSTIVFIPTQTNEMCYQSSVMLKISIIYLSTDQFSPGLLCSTVAAVINGSF